MPVEMTWRGSKAALLQKLRSLPRELARGSSSFRRVALQTLADVLLEEIKAQYLRKSKGLTDDAGIKWAPLAESTIRKRLGGMALNLHMPKSELRRELKQRLKGRFKTAEQRDNAIKVIAARVTPGGRRRAFAAAGGVPILIDKGDLFNGLMALVNSQGIIIRDETEHGKFHMTGTKKMPQRRFLWNEKDDIPPRVWRRLEQRFYEVLSTRVRDYIR